MTRSSILVTAALILAAALTVAGLLIGRMKRERDGWAGIVTRLWDED